MSVPRRWYRQLASQCSFVCACISSYRQRKADVMRMWLVPLAHTIRFLRLVRSSPGRAPLRRQEARSGASIPSPLENEEILQRVALFLNHLRGDLALESDAV